LKSDGFTVEAKGEGNVVSDMLPRPGMSVKAGSKIILYMGSSGNYNDKVVVPDLTGKDDKEASDILKSVGLKIKPNGEGMVTDQKPEPGQEVKKGTTIDVDFEMYLD
ncbi:MAG TPA: stage V sporulation protein D, partial [Clostridiaceae bacterium]|nr:stage V sporulation protein D [Clostridiaceae bacterium]